MSAYSNPRKKPSAQVFVEFAFDADELRDALRLGNYPEKAGFDIDPAVYLKYGTAAVVHDARSGAVVARNEGESLDDFRKRCEDFFGKKVA